MTIESTTSAVKGGVAKRFAALFVAAATLLAGGVFSVSAAPSAWRTTLKRMLRSMQKRQRQ